jgi:type I restriction enzyme R subunit
MTSQETIQSEYPAIELFQKLGYQYINGTEIDERNSIDEVILRKRLAKAIIDINPWVNENSLTKAYNEITNIQASSLLEANQRFTELLSGSKYSVKQIIDNKEQFKPLKFIDYNTISNNDFVVVNQMRFKGKIETSVPDLVVYLNGLPIAVIECKSPSSHTAANDSVKDLLFYQENSPKLFINNVICAGIYKVGAKYGAIGAKTTHYSNFKSTDNAELEKLLGRKATAQDIMLFNLFQKDKLLDIIRHFIIFEYSESKLIKKLPRYQQIQATNKTIAKLQQTNKGGVIWHTQGSGKSITMVYIARKLHSEAYNFNNPTVVIMTDRKDLDTQITNTFRSQQIGVKNISHANSVVGLQKLLKNDYGGIITTTIQKFQESSDIPDKDITEQDEDDKIKVEKYIDGDNIIKITRRLTKEGKYEQLSREVIPLKVLSNKENLYVLVDEAHRSNYGFLASLMRYSIPNAKFIAFTGTPLSKEEKSTLGEFYGGEYIDVYTIRQSVDDGNTVELKYDAGIALLDVKKDELDIEFEKLFADKTLEQKEALKREALRRYQFSTERIQSVAKHIIDHFQNKIYPDKHKAMLVCNGREATILFKKEFERLKSEGYHNFQSKVVVSLGSIKSDDIAKELYETIEFNKQNPTNKKPIFVTPDEDIKTVIENYKLPFGDESEKQLSGQLKYNNDAFMIVSDMLLTGYDCPVASVLYLDKPLKEHNLLQAIARVNRTRTGKSAGFVVDYYGVTQNLVDALKIFSGELLPTDVMKNLSDEIPRLETNHTKLVDFFRNIKIDRKQRREEYIDACVLFLEPINIRDEFKDLLSNFNKSVDIVLPDNAAMRLQYDFYLYNEIKLQARNAYPDDEGLKIDKDECLKIQQLINDHLTSTGVFSLLTEPISIYDRENFRKELEKASVATKELKMQNNLKHTIKVSIDKDPDFFKPLAERLEKVLELRRLQRITQLELFDHFHNIQDEIINRKNEAEKSGLLTESEIVVNNSMKLIFDGKSIEKTKLIFTEISGELGIVDWVNKTSVQKDIENKITKILAEKIDRTEARKKAKELVDLIKKNTNA